MEIWIYTKKGRAYIIYNYSRKCTLIRYKKDQWLPREEKSKVIGGQAYKRGIKKAFEKKNKKCFWMKWAYYFDFDDGFTSICVNDIKLYFLKYTKFNVCQLL